MREVSGSQGLMLETLADRLSRRGGPHFGSPDKLPVRRLETIEAAGRARVPFTTGILIGIGETREERIESLLAIRELGERYGHVQEVIVQNFRAKPGHADGLGARAAARRAALDVRRRARPARGRMEHPGAAEPELRRLPVACSRPGSMTGAASRPSPSTTSTPRRRGLSWNGCRRATEAHGLELAPRLAIYPSYVAELERVGRRARGPARASAAPTPTGSRARTVGPRVRPILRRGSSCPAALAAPSPPLWRATSSTRTRSRRSSPRAAAISLR